MLKRLFSLEQGEERQEKVLESVRSGLNFRGATLWVLIGAILIASIGLNVNSTAVIIGAMLISPVMGPIVGAGFALGTYDFTLLRRSLANLLLCTVIGIAVSAFYFWLTPYTEVQSEILSRTAPTLYDVLIAFTGGLVGVIALTRVEKGNPIPGVAIATALMPPLCTVGYGIATAQWEYSAGALFLYSINCVFICLSTYLIVRALRYPIHTFVNEKKKKRITWIMTILVLGMIIPSTWLAFEFVLRERTEKKIDQFIKEQFTDDGYTLVYKHVNFSRDSTHLQLAFLRGDLPPSILEAKKAALRDYDLNKTAIVIKKPKEVQAEEDTFDQKNKNATGPVVKSVAQDPTENIPEEFSVLFPEHAPLSLYKKIGSEKTYILSSTTTEKDSILERRIVNWLKMRLEADTLLVQRTN